jgi:hypothetical protein
MNSKRYSYKKDITTILTRAITDRLIQKYHLIELEDIFTIDDDCPTLYYGYEWISFYIESTYVESAEIRIHMQNNRHFRISLADPTAFDILDKIVQEQLIRGKIIQEYL